MSLIPKQNCTSADKYFPRNQELLDALKELQDQNFDFYFLSDEGVFVQNQGLVSDEKTLRNMILSAEKLCKTIL